MKKSAAIRERLNHPVIDGDGHIVELVDVLEDYVREIGGAKAADTYRLRVSDNTYYGNRVGPQGWYGLTPQERRERAIVRPGFWGVNKANALDCATVSLPNLFRKRLDEMGIDFAILYATSGFRFLRTRDEEERRIGCRAFNAMCADLYGPHADRMTVAALIPMETPEEALDELEYAVKKLGMKAVTLGSHVRRPIAAVARDAPGVAGYATWIDVLAHASQYDYDPVWAKCVELGVAVTAHVGGMGVGFRCSPENFVYNHIGHFASAGEAFCKALVIGGAVQRFPTLNFAFLEGGVGWACSLYNDLIEHWEKRNIEVLRALDPAKLDRAAVEELFREYGGKLAGRRIDTVADMMPEPGELDEWSALEIESTQAFAGFFSRFFFGCEADDRLTAVAFNGKLHQHGIALQAFFSSDIGHFDVPDITTVVAEAYELVEDEHLTQADFRDFAFANVAKLHAGMNPKFFAGTSVEGAVAAEMAPR